MFVPGGDHLCQWGWSLMIYRTFQDRKRNNLICYDCMICIYGFDEQFSSGCVG